MTKKRHERIARAPAALVPPRPSLARRTLPALVLAAVIGLTYANSLSGAFVLDDQAAVVQNPQIRDLSRLGEVLSPAPDSPVAGRPLASLSLAIDYAAGGLDARGYHMTNLALHIMCAWLVLALVRRTGVRWNAVHDRRVDAGLVSMAAALLWAVHPLNSEVVNYIAQRTESLMALGYLLTLYAAFRAAPAAASGEAAAGGNRQQGRAAWEAAAVAACLAGGLAKESIATAPIVVVLFDRIFLFDSWQTQWRHRRRLYAALACAWSVVGVTVASGARASVVGFSSGVSPWTYALNQAEIITTYLRLTVWPDTLVAFYGWPQPLTIADVAPELAFIAALAALTVVGLTIAPPLGFLGAWFFITLAPASSVVPVATEVGAERRMYLPLVALAVLAALALDAVRRRVVHGERVRHTPVRIALGTAVAAAALALAAVTVARNAEYRTPLTLARTIVERRPTPVAHHMLAEELAREGKVDEAMSHLREAVAGGNSRARYPLGQALASRAEYAEAIEQLEAFVRTYRPPQPLVPAWLEPPIVEVVPARFLLGRMHAAQGAWERSAEQAREILALVPSHIGAHKLLGDAAFARQQWADAIQHYQAYLRRQPDDIAALLNHGVALVAVEQLDAAVAVFERATAIDPGHARARELLALARQDRAALQGHRVTGAPAETAASPRAD